MGEVDQPHDAEDEPDAERREREQATERECVDGVLDQSGHGGPWKKTTRVPKAGPPRGGPAQAG